MTGVVGVIPARWASSRFPGKPLAPIAGVPMIVRVLEAARTATLLDRVLVATDDERIAAVVHGAGGEAVMTETDLPSGTDRVWAAVRDQAAGLEVVVNIQGDEPLLPSAVIDALVARLRADPTADVATPVVSTSRWQAARPDVVTVAIGEDGTAHYFSRATIPAGADPVWRHVGVYAYRPAALARFVAAPPAVLERAERLEQLRALSLGQRIVAVPVDYGPDLAAVDRPEDVAVVESVLAGVRRPAVALVVLDADGVLTDGRISYVGPDAEQVLNFDVKDGYGIVALLRAGIAVAVLSSRDSKALRHRAEELGITEVRAGVADKAAELADLCAALRVPLHDTCVVGDDDPDVALMAMAGLSAAPSDASPAARAAAAVKLQRPGGRGAVRELADLLLSS